MAYLVRTSGQERQFTRGGTTRRRLWVSTSFFWLATFGWLLAALFPVLIGTGTLSGWATALVRAFGLV